MQMNDLVGRGAAVRSVLSSLADPGRGGCLVVADPGIGKTALAHVVTAALGTDVGIFRITGTPTLSAHRFAVLAPYLFGMEPTAFPFGDLVFRSVAGFFRTHRQDSGQPSVMIVDDADDVDPDSRTLLARMVVDGALRLIVLAPRSAIPAEFLELWTDGFLDRCDLTPLNPEEVQILCERVLEKKVLVSMSSMLWHLSKGNPMLLHALLQRHRELGSLFERNGVLTFREPAGPGQILLERMRSDLQQRSQDEVEVLEAVALAEPLPMDLLIRHGLGPAVDHLRVLELITVSGEARPGIRLTSPVLAETLRGTVAAGRRSELRHKYSDALDGMSNERLIRHVAWSLDCGAALSDAVLLRAARAGNEEFNFQFALRAVDAASTNSEGLLLEAVVAHTYLGNRLLARDGLEQLLRTSTDVQLLLNAVLLVCQSFTAHSPSGLARRMNAVLQETGLRVAGNRNANALSSDSLTLLDLIAILGQLADCDATAIEERLRRLTFQSPGINLRARVVLLTLLADLLNTRGMFVQGVQATSLALAILRRHPSELRMESDYAYFEHLRGLLLGGHWDEAKRGLAEHRRDLSLSVMYFGAHIQLLEGILAIQQGQIYAGLEHLRPAVEVLRQQRGSKLLPLGLGMLAYAASLCSETETVDDCVSSFPHQMTPGNRGYDLLGQAYVLAATAVPGAEQPSLLRLAGLAGQARSSGLAGTEREVLALALHLGDRSVAGRLVELTSSMEGPLSDVLHGYATAALTSDADSFLRTAMAARGHGFHLLAVSSAEQASVLLGSSGSRMQNNSAQMLLRQYRTLLDGPTVLTSHESLRSARLTPRERQIMDLVQSGQSNRGIARALSLSARTVEGHLYRIFTKLGVASRAELLILEQTPARLNPD